jgi:transketolase
MRDAFFGALQKVMEEDERVMMLLGDVGAIVLDRLRGTFPQRIINVGIAEKNMMGVAAGLALSGKIVYIFSHAIFATTSCFEQTKLDVCLNNLPVKIIGLGPGLDYSTLGPSHHAQEDIALMRVLPNMTILSPADNIAAAAFARLSWEAPGPVYLRLDRQGEPLIYGPGAEFSLKHEGNYGVNIIEQRSREHLIIGTGRALIPALKMAEKDQATVFDLYRIKPLPLRLCEILPLFGRVTTVEEHNVIGGLGSAVAEVIAECLSEQRPVLTRVGIPDTFCYECGTRAHLQDLLRPVV